MLERTVAFHSASLSQIGTHDGTLRQNISSVVLYLDGLPKLFAGVSKTGLTTSNPFGRGGRSLA